MRISKAVSLSASIASVCGALALQAQPVVVGNSQGIIFPTNRVGGVSNTAPNALGPQSLAPNLAGSNATPAIGRPGISAAMPTPGNPAISRRDVGTAITPGGGSMTAIGQQGFGGAIGQQGTGTAIGQQGSTALGEQGSGTALGQPGAGTAIIPQNPPQSSAIIIGQPEPFTPAPAAPPAATPFVPTLPQPGFGPGMATNSGGVVPPTPTGLARPGTAAAPLAKPAAPAKR